jgi:hypothetical protein
MRYYEIDLRYALWGKERRTPSNSQGWIGWRRLHSLIFALPPEAAINRELEPEAAIWRQDAGNELLANIVEGIDLLRYLMSHQVFDKKAHNNIPKPQRVPRPWDEPEPQLLGVESMKAFVMADKAANS